MYSFLLILYFLFVKRLIQDKLENVMFQVLQTDKMIMTIKEYIPVILGVLKDIRVIGTVIVMILVIEFAKFVTTYRKKPPKPKKSKAAKAAAPAKEEKKEEKPAEGGEAAAGDSK